MNRIRTTAGAAPKKGKHAAKLSEFESFDYAFSEMESRFDVIDLTVRHAASPEQAGSVSVSAAVLEELEAVKEMLHAVKEGRDAKRLHALRGKLFTLETVTIDFLPIATVMSHLRDAASEGLAMYRDVAGSSEDTVYYQQVLKNLDEPGSLSDEQLRQSYLQVRQRIMNLKSRRSAVAVMANRYVNILVKRTTIAVSVLLIPVFVFIFVRYLFVDTVQTPYGATETVSLLSSSYGSDGLSKMIPRITTMSVVALAGVLGAFVSNFARVRRLLHEESTVSAMLPDRYFRVRQSPLIGAVLALFLAEVFGAKLIQGDLFPMTNMMSRWTDLIWHGGAFSKLIVWGFIAGLSESSILNMIGNFAGKLTGKSEPVAQDRG